MVNTTDWHHRWHNHRHQYIAVFSSQDLVPIRPLDTIAFHHTLGIGGPRCRPRQSISSEAVKRYGRQKDGARWLKHIHSVVDKEAIWSKLMKECLPAGKVPAECDRFSLPEPRSQIPLAVQKGPSTISHNSLPFSTPWTLAMDRPSPSQSTSKVMKKTWSNRSNTKQQKKYWRKGTLFFKELWI